MSELNRTSITGRCQDNAVTVVCSGCDEPRTISSCNRRRDKLCRRCGYAARDGRPRKSVLSTEDISGSRVAQWRHGGETRQLSWNITVEDIQRVYDQQEGRCALTGIQMSKQTHDPNVMSLDRIDSGRGYEVDNIQLVTADVNLAKQSLTNEAFIDLCRRVADHQDDVARRTYYYGGNTKV